MKRAEYEATEKEAKRLHYAAINGCPTQKERIELSAGGLREGEGATVVHWHTENTVRGYSLTAHFEGSSPTWGTVVNHVAVTRMAEIERELQAWSRNEGEWPLAKKWTDDDE